MYRILVVDDEPNVINAMSRLLSSQQPSVDAKYRIVVDGFHSPLQALKQAKGGIVYDMVIADYRMPEMDGVAFLRAFRAIQPDAVRLILSGHMDVEGLSKAINRSEIFRFISKPWDNYELQETIGQAMAHQHSLLERRRLANLAQRQALGSES